MASQPQRKRSRKSEVEEGEEGERRERRERRERGEREEGQRRAGEKRVWPWISKNLAVRHSYKIKCH